VSTDAEWHCDTLILGVGNELMTDDGAGVEAARRLREENLGPGVEVIVGGVAGLDLIFELEHCSRAIILDAAHMGLAPGEVRLVRREEIEERLVPLRSLHEIALHDVLDLADLAGVHAEIQLVAVEPAEVLPGRGLTPAVEAAIPEMLRLVKDLLQRTAGGAESSGPT
jgi:hydrogenase maturation protease